MRLVSIGVLLGRFASTKIEGFRFLVCLAVHVRPHGSGRVGLGDSRVGFFVTGNKAESKSKMEGLFYPPFFFGGSRELTMIKVLYLGIL